VALFSSLPSARWPAPARCEPQYGMYACVQKVVFIPDLFPAGRDWNKCVGSTRPYLEAACNGVIRKPMPAPARKPGPASVITRIIFVQYVLQHHCGRVHEHTTLGSRPAPGDTIRVGSNQSGHVEQPAWCICRTRSVRRNRTRSAAGTFSGHRQRSRRICHQKCGCRLSPTTILRRAARLYAAR